MGNLWFTQPAPMPTARFDLVAATVNNVIYAIGGFGETTVLSTNQAYDPVSNSWTTRASMPTARCQLAAAVVNNVIYAMGGVLSDNVPVNTNQAYTPSTNSWSTRANMPNSTSSHAAAAVGGIVYSFGGLTDLGLITNSTYAYNPSTNSWSTRANMPTGRRTLGAAAANNVIYVFGGNTTSASTNVNEAYDPSTNSWSTRANMLAPGRPECGAAVIGNVIYAIISGSRNEAYNPATNSWSAMASLPTSRYECAVAAANNIMYVVGGISGYTRMATNEAYVPPGYAVTVSGTVQNTQGAAASNCLVCILVHPSVALSSPAGWYPAPERANFVTTDASGRFTWTTLANIPANSLAVVAWPSSGAGSVRVNV